MVNWIFFICLGIARVTLTVLSGLCEIRQCGPYLSLKGRPVVISLLRSLQVGVKPNFYRSGFINEDPSLLDLYNIMHTKSTKCNFHEASQYKIYPDQRMIVFGECSWKFTNIPHVKITHKKIHENSLKFHQKFTKIPENPWCHFNNKNLHECSWNFMNFREKFTKILLGFINFHEFSWRFMNIFASVALKQWYTMLYQFSVHIWQ